MCEVSAKVFGKFYSQSRYYFVPDKGEGGMDCCPAGLPSNWHSNQWDKGAETPFFILYMITSLEALQGYQ